LGLNSRENAVKTQIWIAVSIYVLFAIVTNTARFQNFQESPAG
jgi:hypothetical protein